MNIYLVIYTLLRFHSVEKMNGARTKPFFSESSNRSYSRINRRGYA